MRPYAQTLRENIEDGLMSVEEAYNVMREHNVHPRIAYRLLCVSTDAEELLDEDEPVT